MADAFVVWTIFHSNQWSTTCPSKAVVCAVLSGKVHTKDPLLLIGKRSLCGDSGFPKEICHNDHMLDNRIADDMKINVL